MIDTGALGGDWTGTCGFRMMPEDDLVTAASNAGVRLAGDALTLDYTWSHPDDGAQSGTLVVTGELTDGTTAVATWTDSWHQSEETAELTGEVSDGRLRLAMSYAGDWGWVIALEPGGHDELALQMHNVIPQGQARPGVEHGPYVVMDARWTRA